MAPRLRPFLLFLVLLSIFAATLVFLLISRDIYKPLHNLVQQEYPLFDDDMDIGSLIESSKRQIAYLERLEKQAPGKKITFGTDSYAQSWLLRSVQEFLAKLQQNPERKELNRYLGENYLVYQAGGRPKQSNRSMLVTGYYEPLFAGSLTREPPFLTPIYSPPQSLIVLPAGDGKKKIGRYNRDNIFTDYWSRAEIENNNVLKGNELAFLQDPFDTFLLHVQGSGRIQLPDKSIISVRFAGSNGLGYNSIGKLLVDEKIMPLEAVNVPSIRAYLQQHPEQRQRILQHNPRFIFFTRGDANPPRGSSGEMLTPGRSIAMDASSLPGGTIGYLTSRRPVFNGNGTITSWVPLNRFVFPQDSGAAIKGTGRVDIFWGNDNYAEHAANHMKEEGQLYFLVRKGYPGNQ